MDYFELKQRRDENRRIYAAQSWNSVVDSRAPTILPDNTDTVTVNSVDELIDTGNFLTPYEYYSGKYNIQENGIGEGYIKNNVNTVDNTDVGYFWSEDLKNWCSYYVNYGYKFKNAFVLRVWNGRDNWIPIPNLTILYDPGVLQYDIYHIAKIQEQFISKLCNRNDSINGNRYSIIQNRGTCTNMQNDGVLVNMGEPLHVLNGFRLQKNTKYSINDTNFQCIRWSTTPTKYNFDSINELETHLTLYQNVKQSPITGISIVYGLRYNNGNVPEATYIFNTDLQDRLKPRPTMNCKLFTQTNCRAPISQGAPCIWRLPSGEIMLAAVFNYNSDSGSPVYYRNSPAGFKKELLDVEVSADWTGMLGSDIIKAAKWINSYCARFFGVGTDKTITNDWLREYNWAPIDAQYKENTYSNLLDSSLRFEQHNINKKNTLKCKFTVSRPVVTTTAKEQQDYARKW